MASKTNTNVRRAVVTDCFSDIFYQFGVCPKLPIETLIATDSFSTICQIKAAETYSFWITSFNIRNKPMTWEREAKRQSLLKTQRPSS